MRIIDSHAHFMVKGYPLMPSYASVYGEEKAAVMDAKSAPLRESWQRAWRFPPNEPLSDDIEALANRWLADMDAKGVDRMVFLTSAGNDVSERIVAMAPERFIAYAHHDITEKDAPDRLVRAVKEQGLKGYKGFAPLIDIPLSDPSLDPFFEAAESLEIPVLFHFGILGGAGGIADHINISPMALHDVAKAHPRIPFIVPHFGCGFPQETLFLAWACPNVHVDTSGSNQWVRFMPYPLSVRDLLLKYKQTIGAERILFGTDAMSFPRGFVTAYLDTQVRDCVELGFSEREIDQILYQNASRLLKLEDK